MTADNIKSIELMYDPDLYMKGEELFKNKAVKELTSLDKGLYSVIMKDGELIEVELFKPLSKAQRATCECSFFVKNKVCRHLVTALIAYQEYKVKTTPKKKRTEPVKSGTLNINTILSNLGEKDLKNFVKNYATRDKKFATALKVTFARQIDVRDNEAKYKTILNSIIKPISGTASKAKSSDVKNLLKIVDDLHGQLQDAISLNEAREAYLICKNVINKLSYTHKYYDFHIEDLEKMLGIMHQDMVDIIKMEKAPELKKEILQYLYKVTETSYYPFIISGKNSLEIISRFYKKNKEVIDIVKDKIQHDELEERELVLLYSLQFRLGHQLNKKWALNILPNHLQLIEKVADDIMKNNDLDVAKELLMELIKTNPKSLDLRLKLISAHIKSGNKEMAISTSIEAYLTTKRLKILDLMQTVLDEKEFMDLGENIEKQLSKIETSTLDKARFFSKMSSWTKLEALFITKGDFSLIRQFDKAMYKHHTKGLIAVYLHIVEEYLSSHIGSKSNDFVTEVFQHLNKIEATKVSSKVATLIENKFSHRITLQDFYK